MKTQRLTFNPVMPAATGKTFCNINIQHERKIRLQHPPNQFARFLDSGERDLPAEALIRPRRILKPVADHNLAGFKRRQDLFPDDLSACRKIKKQFRHMRHFLQTFI